jgi:hypothetical protein
MVISGFRKAYGERPALRKGQIDKYTDLVEGQTYIFMHENREGRIFKFLGHIDKKTFRVLKHLSDKTKNEDHHYYGDCGLKPIENGKWNLFNWVKECKSNNV